jgi:UDP-hydrolysing UDP-N-acetyl-D-glucosamine 2-epimerase
MSKKRKVCVVVASRANYGRIKSVLQAIKDHPDLQLQLVVSASALLYRFGNAIQVIERDGFKPDAKVYMIIEGENPTTMAKSTGLAIVELATIFENLNPDIVLTVADRFETIATAIAASYMNIPVAHTQGGEITGSIDESVRHAITKLSHIHFPATQESAVRLGRLGEENDRIFFVGCPSIDAIADIDLSLDKVQLHEKGTGPALDWKKKYLLVIQHPVTTEYGQGFEQINATLGAVHELGMQTVWLWPNVDAGSDDVSKGLRVFREKNPDAPIHFFRNFSVEDYARVLNSASCIIGNSSSGLREAAFLGVPCVNVGTRQNGRERGHNVMDADYKKEDIVRAIREQVAHGRYSPDYRFGEGHSGRKIADILSSVKTSIQKKLTY